MIAGAELARISNGATGCTFDYHCYILPVHGRNFKFFDTAGLNEGEMGTVERSVAIAQIYKLITRLGGGINLLMFCMRGPRIKHATYQNWKIFHEILCKKQVPTVLVVTGLEHEENLNEWWWKNRETFEHQGIRPDDTVCIIATRGKLIRRGRRMFDDDYEQSLAKIQNLILNRVLLRPPFVNKTKWFYEVIRRFFFFFQWTTIRKAKDIQKIADACGMSKEETARLKQELVIVNVPTTQ
ncbi:hypothetical protein AZE42_01022 [Rhizopogon vesiculosus]|uniref:G domain-containing protein n=1 Tax=Rhizopogon vesiculosus TaxID=180088 RepID=A0A1J8Q510_9AGAM|nr:hypothetical protein AZE42_01022 [Rhizopogon vesiculosus]